MTGWFLDSSVNFLPQIVVGLALVLVLLAIATRRRRPLAVAAVLIVGLVVALTGYKATLQARAGPGDLRLMTANLLFSNTNVGAVISAIRLRDPDILVVQERVPFWVEVLESLEPELIFLVQSPSSNTAIYFRPKRVSACAPPTLDQPQISNAAVGCLRLNGRETLVLGVHAPRPKDRFAVGERAASLASYRAVLAEARMPALVAGDLNGTPLAPSVAGFISDTRLSVPLEGGPWFVPSWPAAMPALGVRIDQVLTSSEFGARLVAVGPPIGSDHLPVTVEISLPE